MPLYEYKCQSCSEITETIRRVADRNDAPACEHCAGKTRKILSLSAKAHGDLAPYYDDNLETQIESKKHRKQVMEEQGVVEAYGKGWT